jgi:hypothetical protein
MSDILTLDANGFPVVKKSISVSVGVADGAKLVETDPLTGQIDDSLIPGLGTTVLETPLTGLQTVLDQTPLSAVDQVIEAFEKLQAQLLTKDSLLRLEYITGTIVLSTAQNAAIIESPTDCNIFLPQGINNQKYRLRNVGAGKATFIPYGSDTIEKVTSYTLQTTNAFDLVFLNGNWYIF